MSVTAEELVRELDRFVNSEEFKHRPVAEKEYIITYGIPLAISVFTGLKLMEVMQKEMELDRLNKELGIARLEKLWGAK